jgi:hypothetical protein
MLGTSKSRLAFLNCKELKNIMCNLTTGVYRQEISTPRIAGKMVVSKARFHACLLLQENTTQAEVSANV